MMLYLRLLAGLTSFSSNRWRSQRCSIGPDGFLEFSSMLPLPHQTKEYGDRHGNETRSDDPREHRSKLLDDGGIAWVTQTQRLEHAPDAMAQMEADQNHDGNIEDRERNNGESGNEIFISVEGNKIR